MNLYLHILVSTALLAADAPLAAEPLLGQYEVLNDGPSTLAPLCKAVVYQPQRAWCILAFERKSNANWRLIAPRVSHVLDRDGNPCGVTSVTDHGHKTTRAGWISFTFSHTTYSGGVCQLQQSDPTHWIADDATNNTVAIDAR